MAKEQGEQETVLGHVLSCVVPKEHHTGEQQRGQVYEGQTAEHGRTGFWYVDPVHGYAKDKYRWFETS